MLAEHGRFPYSAIVDRPHWRWPGGAGLAVYVGLNLEHFAFGEGLGAELAPGGPQPDVLNYAWREWGNRVGVWYLLESFRELALPVSLLVNAAVYDHCPEVVAAFRARGDEIVGHGRTNAERQGTLDEAAERTLIAEAGAAIARHEGAPPAGWLGPWISESRQTPDLLAEAGYRYLLDWCHDDQPTWMATRAGPILAVPYPQEINDIPMIVGRKLDGRAFADMVVDQFDEMRRLARERALVMGIALHPYIVGQPYRLRHLRRALAHLAGPRSEVWITTAGAIAEHARTVLPPPRPRDGWR